MTTATPTAPRYRVSDVVRAHAAEYLHLRPTTPQQRKTLEAIAKCRTPELGGYVATCDVCDYRRVVYNPCRNRHCPGCEGQVAEKWTSDLQKRLLPCTYFHVVFTLPGELRALAFQNAKLVYGLMLRLAGRALQDVADHPKYLGAQLGTTVVLHTWTQKLLYHPHVHCAVTAGGLTRDGSSWKQAWGKRYFAPKARFGARFRTLLLRALARAHAAGELRFAGGCKYLRDPVAFEKLRLKLNCTSWNVYAKAALGNVDRLIRYFGRYSRRVGISDRRLREVDEDEVTFRYQDRRAGVARTFSLPGSLSPARPATRLREGPALRALRFSLRCATRAGPSAPRRRSRRRLARRTGRLA